MNYSETVNDKGITISNLDGIHFSSMMPAEKTYSKFTIHDLNTINEDNANNESLPRIKKDSKLTEFLQDAGAKPFTSIEECADFQYKLMQIVANQLGLNVKIDTDFIEDPANDNLIMLIAS
ncbi:MAG TPA: hypothetical protein PLL09_00995 [Flavobacterium sp.]|uniref:hypothetical protein n=1 Tax=unclassified Flavobacterium TaxID=196869 RepID=UPI0025C14DD9|nr:MULTISPECIES: hypothetical protein [unclassified Flavobacterium]HRE76376.1 hypothetical protein [Flavobacterium sp.]